MVATGAALQGQLIAAESELQGCVRFTRTTMPACARFKPGLTNCTVRLARRSEYGRRAQPQSSFPRCATPLLGVTYADLLRRTKVEEAVFGTLTQQDELAKVEEAKEIPSVKLLDPPKAPQKKSSPPRLLISILGAVLALLLGSCWILGTSAWTRDQPS